jgi:hypothetical protein
MPKRADPRLLVAVYSQTQHFAGRSALTFECHSEASDVLRELSKSIQVRRECQAKIAIILITAFLEIVTPSPHSSRSPHPINPGEISGTLWFAQRKIPNNRTPGKTGAEHSAPEIQIQLQWLGFAFRSALTSRLAQLQAATAIKRLDCAPSFPWQAVPGIKFQIHPIMPRCEAIFLLPDQLYRISKSPSTPRERC